MPTAYTRWTEGEMGHVINEQRKRFLAYRLPDEKPGLYRLRKGPRDIPVPCQPPLEHKLDAIP